MEKAHFSNEEATIYVFNIFNLHLYLYLTYIYFSYCRTWFAPMEATVLISRVQFGDENLG